MGLVPTVMVITPIPTAGTPRRKQTIRTQWDGTANQLTRVMNSPNALLISAIALPTSAIPVADPTMNDNGMPNPGTSDSHCCSPELSPVVLTAPVVCAACGGTLPRRNCLYAPLV